MSDEKSPAPEVASVGDAPRRRGRKPNPDRQASSPIKNGDAREKPDITAAYESCVKAAASFGIGGYDFCDHVYAKFIRHFVTVDRKGRYNHKQLPAIFSPEASAFLASKGVKIRPNQTPYTVFVRHLMTLNGVDLANLNSGVVSRFATMLWATQIADVEGELTVRGFTKSRGGVNAMLKAFRSGRPSSESVTVPKITIDDARRMEAAAREEGLRQGIKDGEWHERERIVGMAQSQIEKEPTKATVLASTFAPVDEGKLIFITAIRAGENIELKSVLAV